MTDDADLLTLADSFAVPMLTPAALRERLPDAESIEKQ